MMVSKKACSKFRAVDEHGWVFTHTYGIHSGEAIVEDSIEKLAYMVAYLYYRCYAKPEILDESKNEWIACKHSLSKKFADELDFRFSYDELHY